MRMPLSSIVGVVDMKWNDAAIVAVFTSTRPSSGSSRMAGSKSGCFSAKVVRPRAASIGMKAK